MNTNKLSLAGLLLGASLLLAACGGGGGGGGGSSLTVRGTAALGAPIAGASVTATCKRGSGSVTTNSDGSYTVVIGDGEGPCLLKLTQANGVPLYSITSGSGATQTTNITPMTNLLVEYLSNVPGVTAADPASWFAQPAARALLADTTALSTRVTQDFIPALQTLLSNAGSSLTLPVSTDFLLASFTAAPGNTTDDILEELAAQSVVTATGEPAPSTEAALETSASDDSAVPPATGATGASS